MRGPRALTLAAARADVLRADTSANVRCETQKCEVCWETRHAIACTGPKRHAICQDCFLSCADTRFGRTLESAGRVPCVHAPPECVENAYFSWTRAVRRGWIASARADELVASRRHRAFLDVEHALADVTIRHILPRARAYERARADFFAQHAWRLDVHGLRRLEREYGAIKNAPLALFFDADSADTHVQVACRRPGCARGRRPTHARKCGVCRAEHCVICGELCGSTHACDADDAASFQTILRSAQICPGCGEGISKVDGCDQMFCTRCRIAFSYRTGRIDLGRIHNPHFMMLSEAERRRVRVGAFASSHVFKKVYDLYMHDRLSLENCQRLALALTYPSHFARTRRADDTTLDFRDAERDTRVFRVARLTGEHVKPPKNDALCRMYDEGEHIAHALQCEDRYAEVARALDACAAFCETTQTLADFIIGATSRNAAVRALAMVDVNWARLLASFRCSRTAAVDPRDWNDAQCARVLAKDDRGWLFDDASSSESSDDESDDESDDSDMDEEEV